MGFHFKGLSLFVLVFCLCILGNFEKLASAADEPEARPALKLTLREATERALKQSLRIAKSEAENEKAQASVSKAWSTFYPKLDLSASAGSFHDRIPNPGDMVVPLVARDRNNYTGQLILTQSLFAGFGDRAGISSARNAGRAAELNTVAEKNAVIEQVIQWYYGVQMRLRQIEAEKEASVLRESQLSDVKRRVAAGTATDLDRLEAEFSLKSQEPILASLKSELELASLRLSRVLGLELDTKLELTDSLDSTNAVLEGIEVPPLAEAFKQALAKNPEASKLEANIESFDHESRRVQAKHLPSFDIQLAAGSNAYLREDIATQNSLIYSGQLILKVPLFSGLQSIYERRERAAGMMAMRKEQSLLREKILDDLDGAYHQWKLAIARIESETASVRLAEEAARRAKIVYHAGRATSTDVLDSYSRLVAAKKNLAQAMYERIAAIAHIRTIIGNR